ncbi:hypothetical protein ACFPFX_30725 [Streptomyces mauvecolor]|uniref:Transposase n=1 Tax=Streptomyces mauvecolor TaxID=58345 RepID=A0ABV9UVX7_9ACTN
MLPRDLMAQKRLVAERCESLRWEVPRFLKAMWETDAFHYDVVAQIRMDRWSRGASRSWATPDSAAPRSPGRAPASH